MQYTAFVPFEILLGLNMAGQGSIGKHNSH